MARRSSARLRGRNSSTPKRVSLSHDAQPQTPRTAPSKLAALNESEEMPGAFPSSVSPPPRFVQTVEKENTAARAVEAETKTPGDATPIKPAEEEMHPKQHQQSTAKPLEEARWLGFSNMHPQAELPKQDNKLANLQGTPTKTPAVSVASPKVQFTFNREQSLELSPAAKRLMEETREEAVRIREQMIANGDASQNGNMASRKIATPKTRKGRFSNAHQAEFSKMDSIASHHSVRKLPKQEGALNISVATPGQNISQKPAIEASPTKSLKRKQSRADLDEPDRYPYHNGTSTASKPDIPNGSHLPRPMSTNNLSSSPTKSNLLCPTKRVKFTAPDSATKSHKPPSIPGDKVSTPARTPQQIHYPDLSNLASPTQASLGRTASVKTATSKIPSPSLLRSPSKSALKSQPQRTDSPKPSTPLLARSPSKAALFERTTGEVPKAPTITSPLLLRSPTRQTGLKKQQTEESDVAETNPSTKQTPLLARSPLKVSVVKEAETKNNDHVQATDSSATALLQKSPTKLSALASQLGGDSGGTPSKNSENGVLGRFQLLRSSPMKSILRSPQRLYSDDPAKVAAGTHLATPPKHALENKLSGTAQKRVDFTSSTKARYERAQSELSSTPSKGSTSPGRQGPSPKQPLAPSPKKQLEQYEPSAAVYAGYPSLATRTNEVTPSRRRQTTAPGDFTFKAGADRIVFQSPNAPISSASRRPSTIRHVSAEPVLSALTQAAGSKRKFGDAGSAMAGSNTQENDPTGASDKENEEEERPAKRLKKAASEEPKVPVAKTAATKRPTLGVKPKKSEQQKKPSVISRARLDALSQPKRR